MIRYDRILNAELLPVTEYFYIVLLAFLSTEYFLYNVESTQQHHSIRNNLG